MVTSIIFAGLMGSACSDGKGNSTEGEISGRATSVLNKTIQANRAFVVLDLAKSAEEQLVNEGFSDASGGFTAKVGIDTRNLIVAFPQTDTEPRTSASPPSTSINNPPTICRTSIIR